MTRTARSVFGTSVRLTDERWLHISNQHCEMSGLADAALETVEQPEEVYAGSEGELLALRLFDERKWIVVVFKEEAGDGFVITAFLTSNISRLRRRAKLWP